LKHPVEDFGRPCHNFQFLDGTLIHDPRDGRQKLALNNFVAGGKGALVILDYENNEAERFDFPEHAGGRTILQISPTRLIVASEYKAAFLPFDLMSCQWDTAKIGIGPDNDYTWMLSKGYDGWIYSGGYPYPNLYRYDPRTGEAQDLGEMLGEGNLYNRFVAALSNGWVINAVGFNKFALIAFHPKTGEKKQLPIKLKQCATLKVIGDQIFSTWDGRLHLLDGTSFEEISPLPLPVPPDSDRFWVAIHNFSTESALYLRDSQNSLYHINPKTGELQLVWQLDLRGGIIYGIDDKSRVIGIRGQDYFVAPINSDNITLKRIPTEAPATAIHFLSTDPKGGVIGGPGFGQTLFHFDPERQIAINTATVVDAGGEVFDGKFLNGKFYFIAYSRADVAVWNPEAEWDQWNQINPQTLHSYYTEGVCRPRGGMIRGPGGKFYIGFSAHYGHTGGGIAEFDPITNQAQLWMDLIPDHSITALASDGNRLFVGASADAEGMRPVVNDSYFFIFEPARARMVAKHQLLQMPRITSCAYVASKKYVLVADTSNVYIYNLKKLKWIADIPFEISYTEGGHRKIFSVGDDFFIPAGRFIYFIDIDHKRLVPVHEATETINEAIYSEPRIYYSCGSRLYGLDRKYLKRK